MFGGNSLAAVRLDDFNRFPVGIETCAEEQLFYRRAFHRLGCIVDQVDDHAPEKFSIRANGGEIGGKILPPANSFQSAVEHSQSFPDNLVGECGGKPGLWESCELRKFIYPGTQRRVFAFYQHE